MKLTSEALEFFRQAGKRGGKKAAQNLRHKMTKEEISELRRRAVRARWDRKKSA